MFQALNLEVLTLKRVSFGGLSLPKDLKEGQYRELSREELDILFAN